MFLSRYKYILALILVAISWPHVNKYMGLKGLHWIVKDVVIPIVLIVLVAELIVYVDRALNLNRDMEQMVNATQVSGYDPMGSGKNNVSSQRIANAEYYRQMNAKFADAINPAMNEDDQDNAFVNEPDNAASFVENMSGDASGAGGVQTVDGMNAQEAANSINVPKLGSVLPANSVANDTNDKNNSLSCMVGKGDCPLLCSKPAPENPCNIVAPIPGGPWQVQSASSVYKRLAEGKYVPAKCDITKMELIRRGDIPQSAQ